MRHINTKNEQDHRGRLGRFIKEHRGELGGRGLFGDIFPSSHEGWDNQSEQRTKKNCGERAEESEDYVERILVQSFPYKYKKTDN